MARASRRSSKQVTIQSVADRAGVSAMTVSHVLNGTKNVRDETRRTVRDAVHALGYTPSVTAQALASAQATRIGIVYHNVRNAFLSDMLVGALNAASRLGAQVVLRRCDGFDIAEATGAIRTLAAGGANVILLAPPYAELIGGSSLPLELGIPFAAIAHDAPMPHVATFGIDEVAAAAAMTRLFLAEGHRRIAFIAGPPAHASSRGRLAGYREAMAAHGVVVDEGWICPGDFTFGSGLAAATALLDLSVRPTAILACNDDMAAAASSVMHRHGLRVPDDMAIAGFDDAPIAVRNWPPLTTVRQRIDTMAERATEVAVACQRAGASWPGALPPAERMDYELVRRESF